MDRTTILFLAANPDSTTPLHAGREVRRIRERLAGAAHRGAIEIVERWAVRPGDLLPALLEVRPQVVHFSGHGNDERELMLEGDSGSLQPVSDRVLSEIFRLRGDGVRLVVLSACHSLPQAEAIAEHVDCAVGMRRSIGSEAATELSAALYQAIASGDSIQRAFEAARLHLQAIGIPEHRTPQLVVRRSGVDPARIVLTEPAQAAGVVLPFGPTKAGLHGMSAQPGGPPAGGAAGLEVASITLDRREARWRPLPGRQEASPFRRHCSLYLELDEDADEADLPFDVTVLNLASRPVMLSHVGIEVVEVCPRYEASMPVSFVCSTPRGIPEAHKVKKQDAYVVEGHMLFRLLRPHLLKALMYSNARGGRRAEAANDVAGVGAPGAGREAAIMAINEAVWRELDDPVYLEPGAPYRFGVVVRDFREHGPSHMILRVAARTQLGDSYSEPVETTMSL